MSLNVDFSLETQYLGTSHNHLKAMPFTVVRGLTPCFGLTKKVMKTFAHIGELNLVPVRAWSLGVTSAPEQGRCENASQADHTCLPGLFHSEKWLTVG